MCWFHANATQFWIRAVINLGFYPQEALKPIHQRCWEGTHTLTAPTTHQTEALYNVRTRFPYHYLEASIEDHVWSGGLTQDATSAKVSPVMVRSWIWNSPSSSPVLGSALSFWEQSKAHLSVGCILSSQALAFKPGSHENVQVFCPFPLQNQESLTRWLLSWMQCMGSRFMKTLTLLQDDVKCGWRAVAPLWYCTLLTHLWSLHPCSHMQQAHLSLTTRFLKPLYFHLHEICV